MGKLLAYAAMKEGKEISWMPSYGPEMRGGTANCMVNIMGQYRPEHEVARLLHEDQAAARRRFGQLIRRLEIREMAAAYAAAREAGLRRFAERPT